MNLEVYRTPTTIYVRLGGRVVLDDCQSFRQVVFPMVEDGPGEIAMDLEQAEFIDSAGLGALVGMKVRGGKIGARVVLVSPSPAISDILTVSKLSNIFDIVTGLDAEAMRAATVAPEHLVHGPHDTAATSAVLDPESRIAEEKRLAEEAAALGQPDQAIEHYERLIELDPENLEALRALADALEERPVWHNRALAQWEHTYQTAQRLGDEETTRLAQQKVIDLRKV